MKALLIAETESVLSSFSRFLERRGYDIIRYRWLMKAMDNLEEISPDILVLNCIDYPRHWKIFAQFASSGAFAKKPKIILVVPPDFSAEEQKKAEYLNVSAAVTDAENADSVQKLETICGTPASASPAEKSETAASPSSRADNSGTAFPQEQPENPDAVFSFIIPGSTDSAAGTVISCRYPMLTFSPQDKTVFSRVRFGQIIPETTFIREGKTTHQRAQIRSIQPEKTLGFCLLK
ncbi:MAG: hypothetical protein NC041_04785 [Bacteroides sp.]|nr:hypothetical protein [Prevotella sp.]MCM1407275.1 hypothetical protein [Treponema brennaborense]MCM1469763.1 hypothetical protein [Bacteroides sp.]